MTYITALFSLDGAPETGPSPTVTVLRLSDDTVVLTAQAMAETSLGGYYSYDWTAYDPAEEYVLIADGGAVLPDADRYKHGGSAEADIKLVLDDTAAMQPLVDVATSTRSSHSPADVDTELSATHGAGSWEGATAALDIIRGLLHDKALLDQIVENGDENLLTGRLRIYDSAVNQEAAEATSPAGGTTGLVATYVVRATYDGRRLSTYVVVPQ